MHKTYGTLLQIKHQSYVNGELYLAFELRDSMLLRCQFSSICSADSKPSQSESQQAFVHPSVKAFLHKEVLSSFFQFLRQNSNAKWRRLIMDIWHLQPTFGHPFLFYISLISPFQKMFDVWRKKENVFLTERWLTSLREDSAGIETGQIRRDLVNEGSSSGDCANQRSSKGLFIFTIFFANLRARCAVQGVWAGSLAPFTPQTAAACWEKSPSLHTLLKAGRRMLSELCPLTCWPQNFLNYIPQLQENLWISISGRCMFICKL